MPSFFSSLFEPLSFSKLYDALRSEANIVLRVPNNNDSRKSIWTPNDCFKSGMLKDDLESLLKIVYVYIHEFDRTSVGANDKSRYAAYITQDIASQIIAALGKTKYTAMKYTASIASIDDNKTPKFNIGITTGEYKKEDVKRRFFDEKTVNTPQDRFLVSQFYEVVILKTIRECDPKQLAETAITHWKAAKAELDQQIQQLNARVSGLGDELNRHVQAYAKK